MKFDYRHIVLQVYQEFYRQVTMNYDYAVSLRANDERLIQNFINRYLKKDMGGYAGVDFIMNYMESGFNYWLEETDVEDSSKYGLRSIQLNWLIGKKAYERYERIRSQDNEKWRRDERFVRRKVGLTVKHKLSYLYGEDNRNFFAEFHQHEDINKQRFYNKKEGLEWCLDTTTLYHQQSNLCVGYINKDACREILLMNYPKLALKRRIYD